MVEAWACLGLPGFDELKRASKQALIRWHVFEPLQIQNKRASLVQDPCKSLESPH